MRTVSNFLYFILMKNDGHHSHISMCSQTCPNLHFYCLFDTRLCIIRFNLHKHPAELHLCMHVASVLTFHYRCPTVNWFLQLYFSLRSLHQRERTSYVMVSSWPPFKQVEFYNKSSLLCDRIIHTKHVTCVTCAL